MTLLLALACANTYTPYGECEVLVSPDQDFESGVGMGEPCYLEVEDAHGEVRRDYTDCCPDGYEAIGLTEAGDVVCWCGDE